MAQSVDIAEFVNSAVTGGVGDLVERFRTGRPFRHVVIEDFLTPAFCSAVCSEFPAFEDGASLNEDGQPGGKATQEQVRALGPAFERMDDLIQSPAFLGWWSGLPESTDFATTRGISAVARTRTARGRTSTPTWISTITPLRGSTGAST